MNREYIVLVVFLVATLLAAGYVFTIQDHRELKLFNNSEISFYYPAEYSLQTITNTNGTMIRGTANNKSFNISKTSINSSFSEYTTALKKDIAKENFFQDQTGYINGIPTYQILYIPIPPLGNFFPRNTLLVLDKNNNRYVLNFSGENTLKDIPLIEKNLEIY